jgi:hypothetical protein
VPAQNRSLLSPRSDANGALNEKTVPRQAIRQRFGCVSSFLSWKRITIPQ